ncbi:MAG: polysaccharide deacetylase family protein [Planctomycetia bacterium]|nr:polysaccharide deacetylase family protein [Planctomycetia bacterium]
MSKTFERDMGEVITILDNTETKATFFVTGTVAKERPELLRRWAALGHEMASHGYSHTPIWAMTAKELKDELEYCKRTIEDAIGQPITGYRAPIFSVRWDTLWALDVIRQCGFTYDSSMVPVRMR